MNNSSIAGVFDAPAYFMTNLCIVERMSGRVTLVRKNAAARLGTDKYRAARLCCVWAGEKSFIPLRRVEHGVALGGILNVAMALDIGLCAPITCRLALVALDSPDLTGDATRSDLWL